jgi:hypothetical protein
MLFVLSSPMPVALPPPSLPVALLELLLGICSPPSLPLACRHMLKVMRGIPVFTPGSGPFSDSHPFWSEFTLVPYDTPVTVWRTPPGSAPGTLQAALNAAAVGAVGLSSFKGAWSGDLVLSLCPPSEAADAALQRSCSGCWGFEFREVVTVKQSLDRAAHRQRDWQM